MSGKEAPAGRREEEGAKHSIDGQCRRLLVCWLQPMHSGLRSHMHYLLLHLCYEGYAKTAGCEPDGYGHDGGVGEDGREGGVKTRGDSRVHPSQITLRPAASNNGLGTRVFAGKLSRAQRALLETVPLSSWVNFPLQRDGEGRFVSTPVFSRHLQNRNEEQSLWTSPL